MFWVLWLCVGVFVFALGVWYLVGNGNGHLPVAYHVYMHARMPCLSYPQHLYHVHMPIMHPMCTCIAGISCHCQATGS